MERMRTLGKKDSGMLIVDKKEKKMKKVIIAVVEESGLGVWWLEALTLESSPSMRSIGSKHSVQILFYVCC